MKTTMVSVSDQDLVSRYIRGEKSAFEILLLRHKNRVYSYVQQMVRDRELANDIFQSVFLKALETLNLGRYHEEGKFLPWLMRIAHNQCIDHFRREKRMPMLNSNDERDVFEYLDLRVENAPPASTGPSDKVPGPRGSSSAPPPRSPPGSAPRHQSS